MGEAERGDAAPRQRITYFCANGHETAPMFAVDAQIPDSWDCPRCGLHFEREQGYWTGAVAINTIIVGAVFVVVFVTAIVLTAPDIPLVPVLLIVIPVMVIGPLIAYPFSKTLWVAVDRAFLQRLSFS